jgi:hypothetical protein
MKIKMSALLFSLALGVAQLPTFAQDAPPAQPPAPGGGQGQSQHGGRGGWGGGGGMMGRGLMGTVTEVAADHYSIKTDTGDAYTVHFSANTRIVKQMGPRRAPGQGGEGMGGNPPQPIKPTDIKVGDAIGVMGEVDAATKSVGAVAIAQMDPERARQMREMQANFGKTWLMGKVTAIDGVTVTLKSNIDNSFHTFVADENTLFRQRRDPITLADIQVGDMVRVEGAVKAGTFVAATVNSQGMQPPPTTVPRDIPPPPMPK